MPRKARLIIANSPHHILQRGHNRQIVFRDDEDFEFYANNIRSLKLVHKLKLYAYCLMPNHIHIIVDPVNEVSNISAFMKSLAIRQTRFFNSKYSRSGTLWESRYISSPVEAERYLLACCRYVEMNPVRSKRVNQPMEYLWSSYGERFSTYSWIDQCPCFNELDTSVDSPIEAYKIYMMTEANENETKFIQSAMCKGKIIGDASFIEKLSSKYGFKLSRRSPGRPRKIIANAMS